jgi:hypothetical protein
MAELAPDQEWVIRDFLAVVLDLVNPARPAWRLIIDVASAGSTKLGADTYRRSFCAAGPGLTTNAAGMSSARAC